MTMSARKLVQFSAKHPLRFADLYIADKFQQLQQYWWSCPHPTGPCLTFLSSYPIISSYDIWWYDWRSPTRTPRISNAILSLVRWTQSAMGIYFLSIVWCHLSDVSVVFLNVCFRRWCHLEHDVCTDCQFALHGRSIVASFFWLLPGMRV